jgi:hypothetical protein
MGMDAFVPCRCWEDGRTKEPPAPRADVRRTEGMLDLTLPYDGNEVLWREFDAWTHDGCRHVDMEYAAVHIGNWSGYRQFQWALDAAGRDRFPVLLRVLPDVNGGETSPSDAADALTELDANGLFVIDTPGGEEVFRAHRVGQRVVGDGTAWLSDLDRPEQGAALVHTVIGGGASLLLTRSRSYHPADFAGTVEALRRVFGASVEIGSPVYWT